MCRTGDRNRRSPLHHALACSISPKFNSRPKRVAWRGACGCELAHIQAREPHGALWGSGALCTNLSPPVTYVTGGYPFIVDYFCAGSIDRRVLDEVRMDQPSEFNRSKVRTHRLLSVTGGVAGELMKGVLMAMGGLTAMAVLVVLASFAVSALL